MKNRSSIKKIRMPRKLKKKDKLRLWVNEFNRKGKKFGYYIGNGELDFDDWIDYYDDGYTPQEAITEDLSYAF